jgi:hypothetical protein
MEWLDSKRPCAHCYLHGTRPCHQAGADGFSPCYDEINITELVEKYETLIERCK